MKRRGAVNLPLHGGHPPSWLFSRMVKLSGALTSVIIEEYSLEELRRLLDAEKYERWIHFKQRVLEPSIEEINSYSDKNVVWEPIKKGKSVEEVADLLDVDIDKVKAVEENILVNA